MIREPVFQGFVANLGLAGTKACSEDPARFVLNAPENIGARFAIKGAGIGKGGNVLAYVIGNSLVVFELDPLRLPRKGSELAHESLELHLVHHTTSPKTSIFLVTAAAMRACSTPPCS